MYCCFANGHGGNIALTVAICFLDSNTLEVFICPCNLLLTSSLISSERFTISKRRLCRVEVATLNTGQYAAASLGN